MDTFDDCIARAQQILGHEFRDTTLLVSALTHPSAVESEPVWHSYERLEFLGDSILGAIIATDVFTRYRDMDEGQLSKLKIALTSGPTLTKVANDLGLGECIRFGPSELGTDSRGMRSALENVFEAVVGALYLDAGFDVAHDFIVRVLEPHCTRDLIRTSENPKSRLQELLQAKYRMGPTYELVSQDGPAHTPTFTSKVYLGERCLGEGSGTSRKRAESAAAEVALDTLKNPYRKHPRKG